MQQSKTKKYRVAVVGGAGIWGLNYLRAYSSHPDCEVTALVDLARDRRQTFADHFGVESVYDTVEDLLAGELPDIVSIILPVSASPGAVISCARPGVKVISCEKPIAATLAEVDKMVEVCREGGVALGCGTAFWESPHFLDTAAWIQAGNIGSIIEAAIPNGLANEVSGSGCVSLTMLRKLTGMDVKWVEGWTIPAQAAESDDDCTAYGRLGLVPSGICEIPPPERKSTCRISILGEAGQVWITAPKPVFVQGSGVLASPVYPDFLNTPQPDNFIIPTIERLMRTFDTDGEAPCSGHDYRQALEIAIALKLSARRNHERVHLPLEDRSLAILPQPYRLLGGDVAGWESRGPPRIE